MSIRVRSLAHVGLVAAMAAAVAPAHAAVTVAGSVGGAPTGVTYENFDSLAANSNASTHLGGADGLTVSFSGNAKAVQGAVGGQYAAPFISGSNGAGFGNMPGADTTTYLSTGTSSVTITFDNLQKYVGLLWSSVDGYNSLDLYDTSNSLLATLTGNDVTASPNGDQGVNGTLYVNINSDTPFKYIVARSSSFAFEFETLRITPSVRMCLHRPR